MFLVDRVPVAPTANCKTWETLGGLTEKDEYWLLCVMQQQDLHECS